MNKNVIAIIPARGGSKRIPRKNIRQFMGKPVISYPITAAIQSGCFGEVMVSTDDTEIAEVAKSFGAVVPFMRSEKTANDYASTADVLLEVLEEYKKLNKYFNYCCCIYPVTPLINTEILNNAMTKIIETKADSLMPVIRYSHPIQRALQIDFNDRLSYVYPENAMMRTQDLPSRFHDAGQFYFLNVDTFLKNKTLVSKNTTAIQMSENCVQDIDTEDDWQIAELKYQFSNLSQLTFCQNRRGGGSG
ncbi:MAG: pseudaminic acid cytidylyltransferase [Planctomycetaceae bacterium]|jgi:N-acylneuraminate cytidylyltransferase|nr:pseudaminic acid cytidylyltransferase [Planctomycetaceae bacterium]